MRKITHIPVFIFLYFAFTGAVFAAAAEDVLFKISSVTVYNGVAIVERRAVLSVPSGEAVFLVKDLPAELYPESLLVSKADKDAPFLVKEFEFKDVEAAVVLQEAEKKLKEKLNLLKDDLKSKQDRLEVLKAKMKFYNDLSGKAAGDAALELGRKDISVKNTADVLFFIAAGLEASMKEKRVLEKQAEKLSDEINITQSQLSELNVQNTRTSKVLQIRLAASAPLSGDVKIKYVVPNVSWYPAYECNYMTDQGSIEAGYHAMIQQSTSEKWEGIKLTVATGAPFFDVTLPVPQPWLVDEQRVYAQSYGVKASKQKRSSAKYDAEAPAAMAEAAGYAAPAEAPVAAEFKQEELNIKAALTGKFSVSNNGEVKKAILKEMKLKKKDVFYTVVPSQNEAAYLTVEFENNDELVMIPGEVALYMDGNYSGKSNINNTVRKGESLKFSFGIDENIKIKKENLQEKKGESGIFGSDKKTDFGRKITVENYKQRDIVIYVKEPMPVSQNDKITVDIYETGIKPDAVESQGIYVWKLNLKPGEKKEIIYRFRVTHPKDMNVGGI